MIYFCIPPVQLPVITSCISWRGNMFGSIRVCLSVCILQAALKFSVHFKDHHILDKFEGQGHRSKVKVTMAKSPSIRKGGPSSRSSGSRSRSQGQGKKSWASFLPHPREGCATNGISTGKDSHFWVTTISRPRKLIGVRSQDLLCGYQLKTPCKLRRDKILFPRLLI